MVDINFPVFSSSSVVERLAVNQIAVGSNPI